MRLNLPSSFNQSARDYLEIYEMYDLLGDKSLFGHCIHLSEREKASMAETGSIAVFCPTSNLFLGSGLFDFEGMREKGVRTSVATDTGGGTSYSMLKTMDEAYKILQLRNQILSPLHSLLHDDIGQRQSLEPI